MVHHMEYRFVVFRYSVTAITSRFHRGDRGSTPRIGVFSFFLGKRMDDNASLNSALLFFFDSLRALPREELEKRDEKNRGISPRTKDNSENSIGFLGK